MTDMDQSTEESGVKEFMNQIECREEILEMTRQLRHTLHACPEVSGEEVKTKATLQAFLKEHTTLELHSCGAGFYAAHREAGATESVAFRADYDALALSDGGAAHLCGHDGHAASLCAVALMLEGQQVGKNVFLLFQPAEETGAGAYPCTELFEKEQIDEIYGMHNLPGYPLGQVLTRKGTFACGSEGIILEFHGKPTHAAYPENGISPATAVGKLLEAIPDFQKFVHGEMVLCTVIGVRMGEKAFGAAASDVEVWLTLRAERGRDLERLRERILQLAESLAKEYQLTLESAEQDVFPATENDSSCVEKVLAKCNGQVLEEPMRWSEDFGHYLKHCRGAFFGIGAGEECPALHTEHYEYPDELLKLEAVAFVQLL